MKTKGIITRVCFEWQHSLTEGRKLQTFYDTKGKSKTLIFHSNFYKFFLKWWNKLKKLLSICIWNVIKSLEWYYNNEIKIDALLNFKVVKMGKSNYE